MVFLGLLVAGTAVPDLLLQLLPRLMAITGLVIAMLVELSTVTLIWQGAAALLPLARFPGLVWQVARVHTADPRRVPQRRTRVERRCALAGRPPARTRMVEPSKTASPAGRQRAKHG